MNINYELQNLNNNAVLTATFNNFSQLINGIDYPGVQVTGALFEESPGFDVGPTFGRSLFDQVEYDSDGIPCLSSAIVDSIIQSNYTDDALGTRPEDINIVGGDFSTQNKMLDIYMNTDIINTTQATTQVLLAGSMNLPVYYNSFTQQPNSSYLWNDFKFEINLDKSILLDVGSILRVPLNAPQELVTNSIKPGDVLHLNNLFVGTSSIYDFSGQYAVQSVDSVDSYIILDISSNASLVNFGSTASLPLSFNSTPGYLLSNFPYFSFNKGKKIRITRISNSTVLKERYTINIEDIK